MSTSILFLVPFSYSNDIHASSWLNSGSLVAREQLVRSGRYSQWQPPGLSRDIYCYHCDRLEVESEVSEEVQDPPPASYSRQTGFWKRLRFSSRLLAQQTAASSSTERAAVSVPSRRRLEESSEERLDETADRQIDGSAPLPSPMALKLWEEGLATFESLAEDQLQFAMVGDEYLVIVPRDARHGQTIYQIEHCTLPVVLGNLGEGDSYLVGEAYVDRQPDGAWLPALKSLSPSSKRESKRSKSTMRINLSRSAVVRSRRRGYLTRSESASEAE